MVLDSWSPKEKISLQDQRCSLSHWELCSVKHKLTFIKVKGAEEASSGRKALEGGGRVPHPQFRQGTIYSSVSCWEQIKEYLKALKFYQAFLPQYIPWDNTDTGLVREHGIYPEITLTQDWSGSAGSGQDVSGWEILLPLSSGCQFWRKQIPKQNILFQ